MAEAADSAGSSANRPLLEVSDLVVAFGSVRAVRGVSFGIAEGETLAVVGESGSGKSLTSLAALNLLPGRARVEAGTIRFDGRDLAEFTDRDWRKLRGEQAAMVFQDPLSALNPSLTVGYQIAEMFRRHRGAGRRAAGERALELMEQVGIPDAGRRAGNYPHEFSGGMRQRVMIAMALALDPRLLIADEPTTALDVTVQAQILRLLRERQRRDGLAMIIISHDLGVVARTAQSVVVMYAGRAVESGPIPEVYRNPAHPYTLGLLQATPATQGGDGEIRPIKGHPPDIADLPSGCAFHPRCPFARRRCREKEPELREVAPGRSSACHFAEEVLSHGTATDRAAS